MNRKIRQTLAGLLLLAPAASMAQRTFQHPGITYTQADLDRMKAMVEAHREPFYTAYLGLLSSSYSSATAGGRGEGFWQIEEGAFNGTIGADGRRAHDCALIYRLTGNTAYADNAVRILNSYNGLVNASHRGTAPLDNGKINLLVEAAELVRDYEGWDALDQQAFRDMLVYPYYSQTEAVDGLTNSETGTTYATIVDSLNRVSIYWNIYQGDAGRYGNQGLFAMRGLLSMAIYLDNEVMYDRVWRLLNGMEHRSDDLPYEPGPRYRNSESSTSETQIEYDQSTNSTSVADYGYDEVLKYYIYPNGQTQESHRDQGHAVGGVNNYACMAEMFWNQGDDLYSALDNRILKGSEYMWRYNMSYLKSYDDQPEPWEPDTAFAVPDSYLDARSDTRWEDYLANPADSALVTDPATFLQVLSRSARWRGLWTSDVSRGDVSQSGGVRELTLSHYKCRMGVDAGDCKWTQRALDYLVTNYGYENWGISPNWYYENTGWGTLTKRLTSAWMAGDPGTWESGTRVSRLPSTPCTIAAVDYDAFTADGEGRTYHNNGTAASAIYRTDGTPEIALTDYGYCLTQMENGEWTAYTVNFSAGAELSEATEIQFNVYATYTASAEGGKLFASVDDCTPVGKELEVTDTPTERLLGTVTVEAGAAVLRVYTKGAGNVVNLYNIRLAPLQQYTDGKLDLTDAAVCTVRVYDSSNNALSGQDDYIGRATDGDYSVAVGMPTKRFMVFDFGEEGATINKIVLTNDGQTMNDCEQAKIYGDAAGGSFTGEWDCNEAQDILRTNGNSYTGASVLTNDWTTAGGQYAVSVGECYRYVGFYNWSYAFRPSEVEIYSHSQLVGTDETADTEEQASWDDLDGEATGVSSVGGGAAVPGAVYNLSGRRVKAPAKGVYIVNGRKVIC